MIYCRENLFALLIIYLMRVNILLRFIAFVSFNGSISSSECFGSQDKSSCSSVFLFTKVFLKTITVITDRLHLWMANNFNSHRLCRLLPITWGQLGNFHRSLMDLFIINVCKPAIQAFHHSRKWWWSYATRFVPSNRQFLSALNVLRFTRWLSQVPMTSVERLW